MVAQGQLFRAEVNNTGSSVIAQGQLFRVEFDSTASTNAFGRLYRVEMSTAAGTLVKGFLYRVAFQLPTAGSAGPDLTNVEPFSIVTLTAVDTADISATRVWVQVSGIDVTASMVQNGKVLTFLAPGTAKPQDYVFGYTVDGSTQDTAKVSVQAASEWAIQGGRPVALQMLAAKL